MKKQKKNKNNQRKKNINEGSKIYRNKLINTNGKKIRIL